jgi:biopolymer transport protein ExbD
LKERVSSSCPFRPSSVSNEPGARREDAITVGITRDGWIFFNDQRIRLEDLQDEIQKAIRSGAEYKVYVKPDARCMYRDFARVVDEVRAAKVEKIAFITIQRAPARQLNRN